MNATVTRTGRNKTQNGAVTPCATITTPVMPPMYTSRPMLATRPTGWSSGPCRSVSEITVTKLAPAAATPRDTSMSAWLTVTVAVICEPAARTAMNAPASSILVHAAAACCGRFETSTSPPEDICRSIGWSWAVLKPIGWRGSGRDAALRGEPQPKAQHRGRVKNGDRTGGLGELSVQEAGRLGVQAHGGRLDALDVAINDALYTFGQQTDRHVVISQHDQPAERAGRGDRRSEQRPDVEDGQDTAAPVRHAGQPDRRARHAGQLGQPAYLGNRGHADRVAGAAEPQHDVAVGLSANAAVRTLGHRGGADRATNGVRLRIHAHSSAQSGLG